MTIPDNRRIRFAIYGVVAAVLLLIGALDRPYLARAKILPQDPSESGPTPLLSSAVRPSAEFFLAVGRSREVQERAASDLKLQNKMGLPDADKVERLVHVDAIPGGLLLIEVTDGNPTFARRLLAAYVGEIDKRLGDLGRERTDIQKAIAKTRLAEALSRLANAKNTLDAFQKKHGFGAPEDYFGPAATSQIKAEAEARADQIDLDNQIQINQIQFAAAKKNQDNKSILRNQANKIANLQRQRAKLENYDKSYQVDKSNLSQNSLAKEYLNLLTEERYSAIIYDSYSRYLQQSLFWEINSKSNIQIIDKPYIAESRVYNKRVMAAFLLLFIVIFLLEVYFPASRGKIFDR